MYIVNKTHSYARTHLHINGTQDTGDGQYEKKKITNATRRTRNGLESIIVSISLMFHELMRSFHDLKKNTFKKNAYKP